MTDGLAVLQLLLLASLAANFHTANGLAQAKALSGYSVIIDAGSSGSRVHVLFHQAPDSLSTYPRVVLPSKQQRVVPGLSFYAPSGIGAGQSLQPLLRFALNQVPTHLHASTPLHVFATAGLRMLPNQEQIEAVLDSVRVVCEATGFLFHRHWARVLTGQQEGLYAWVAYNYATGVLQKLAASKVPSRSDASDPASPPASYPPPVGDTWGVVEMGGASIQVTFMPEGAETIPAKYLSVVNLPGLGPDAPLYTYSFQGYGIEVMLKKVLAAVNKTSTNPCLPSGYTPANGAPGSGSFRQCIELLKSLQGPNLPCPHEQCSVGDEYLPTLTGTFLATEAFYYNAIRLGMVSGAASTANTERRLLSTATHALSSLLRGSLHGWAVADQAGESQGLVEEEVWDIPDQPGQSPELFIGSSGTVTAAQHVTQRTGHHMLPLAVQAIEHVAGGRRVLKAGDGAKRSAKAASAKVPEQQQPKAKEMPLRIALAQLATAGEAICRRSWMDLEADLVNTKSFAKEYVIRTCLSSAHSYAMLRYNLHFQKSNKQLAFSNQVQTAPKGKPVAVNWVIGALLIEVIGPDGDLPAIPPAQEYLDGASHDRGALRLVGALAGGLLLLVACSMVVYRWGGVWGKWVKGYKRLETELKGGAVIIHVTPRMPSVSSFSRLETKSDDGLTGRGAGPFGRGGGVATSATSHRLSTLATARGARGSSGQLVNATAIEKTHSGSHGRQGSLNKSLASSRSSDEAPGVELGLLAVQRIA